MFKQTIIVGTNTLTQMARQLFFKKQITIQQLYEIEKRNSQMQDKQKNDLIILEEQNGN